MGHFYSFSLISSHLHPTPLYKKKKNEIKKQNSFIKVNPVKTEAQKLSHPNPRSAIAST